MISSKRLLRRARNNLKMADAHLSNKPPVADKGHFVVYTVDNNRFVIPLPYLSNNIFQQLFKMSEEEFGLSSDGPITLPCDSVTMNYIVLLIQRGLAKDLEKAVLDSLTVELLSVNYSSIAAMRVEVIEQ